MSFQLLPSYFQAAGCCVVGELKSSVLLPVEPPTCNGQDPGMLACLGSEQSIAHVNKTVAVLSPFLRKRGKSCLCVGVCVSCNFVNGGQVGSTWENCLGEQGTALGCGGRKLLALRHSHMIRSYRKSSCLLAAQKYVSNWLCWHFTVCKLTFLRKLHRIYVYL